MINLARQALSNPFLSAVGAPSFQPGVSAVGRCPYCGNAVAAGTTIQSQTTGLNPQAVGAGFGQQMGGFVPNPYAVPQPTGGGQINPFASQFGQLSHHGVGGQASGFGVGGYSIDPRLA